MSWAAVAGAAVGVAGGYLANQGSKQGGSIQQSGSNAPWGPQQGYLQDIFGRAQGLSMQPNLVPQSPYSANAIAQMASQAQDPNSLVARSQAQLGDTISGKYLDVSSNPYLQGSVQQALDQVKRNVSSRFSGESYGSSANQEWLGKSLADTALPIYANNYQKERQNQLTSLGLAPGLQQANTAQLGQAGQLQEARGQAELNAPWDQLRQYGGLISGNYGNQSTSTSPYFTNPWANMLGGGLAGLQMYNQVRNAWNPQQTGTPGVDYSYGAGNTDFNWAM